MLESLSSQMSLASLPKCTAQLTAGSSINVPAGSLDLVSIISVAWRALRMPAPLEVPASLFLDMMSGGTTDGRCLVADVAGMRRCCLWRLWTMRLRFGSATSSKSGLGRLRPSIAREIYNLTAGD